MAASIAYLSDERLIRRAPAAPLPLSAEDQRYILNCLREVGRAFGQDVLPDIPLDHLPGQAVIRHLLELRRTLHPQSADQRSAHGGLISALLLADTARALAEDLAGSRHPRSPSPDSPDDDL